VYAGAAREAVFSNPQVVRRIQTDFVPLALRAPLVNQADSLRDQDEKWLYQRINRAKLAPQGICLLNSSGQVLSWVQMFDSNKDVLAFLDHGRKLFRKHPTAKRVVATERYLKFPSTRVKDVRDGAKVPVIARAHPKGKTCPAKYAKGKVAAGDLLAQLVGRALDKQGKPLADVVNQEHYAEDRFLVPARLQAAVARALAKAGKAAVPLPGEFARFCATYANLGHIDVRPLFEVGGHENKGKWKRCEFRARKFTAGKETTLWRIEGESEVVSKVAINGDGVHNVKLAWEGFIEVKGERLLRLLLAARGTEKLQFSNNDNRLKKVKGDEVAFLPAGRPINVDSAVRYGIIGEPVAEDQVGAEEPTDAGPVPEEAGRHLTRALGTSFLVFHPQVQKELRLSAQQKQQLRQRLQETFPDTMKFFAKLKDLKPGEREKKHHAHRQTAQEKLAAFLKKTLKPAQRRRLRQIELQQEGLFGLLGRPKLMAELKVTDQQRRQFMAVVEKMGKKIQPLLQKAQSGGKPEEIGPKVLKIRKEHESKAEAILSAAQKRQWKKLLGKPFDLNE
jgi:hypothetical protein